MVLNRDDFYFYDMRIYTLKQLKYEYIEFLTECMEESYFDNISFNYWLNDDVRTFPLHKFNDTIYVNKNDEDFAREIGKIISTSEGYNKLIEQLSEYNTYTDGYGFEHIVYHPYNNIYVID